MDGVLLSSTGAGTPTAFGASQIAWNGGTGIATSGLGANNVVVSASAVNLNGSAGISARRSRDPDQWQLDRSQR
jgi:hypothetical protein